MNQDEIVMVLTHVPDIACANQMAEALLDAKLAACVNIMAACQSIYHWNGQLERSPEIPIMIKTTRHAYAAVEARILTLHPYELPEIITLHVNGGLPTYLQWVAAQIVPQSQPQ